MVIKTEGASMRVPTIYLETTIFNFPFAGDAPQYQADTKRLFAEIKAGKFQPYTSDYVTRELEITKDAEKLSKMKALITDYGITMIPANPEIERLADVYVTAGVIPGKYATDALHIAAAAVAGLDYIVSLNFRHIVKHKTIIETEIINAREGYKRVFIHTPAEVLDYEEDD
jgi:predicted nucleic acid-binding protein